MVQPLISAEELMDELSGSSDMRKSSRGLPPRVLDVRWSLGGPPGRAEYARGHIPGAQFVDLDTELAGPPGPGRHPLPDSTDFAAAMRRSGVSSGRPVVVYDASSGLAAARAWWLLRYFGHPAVRVLDGGFAAWTAAGGSVVAGDEPAPAPGDFAATPGHMVLLEAGAAAKLAAAGALLDARAPERFRGEVEPVDPVAGHIPGARNLPTSGNIDAEGRFLPAAELRARFADAGAVPGAPVGAYCGSGVTAAHEVLALAVAGIEAGLYVGSWSDWITDPTRPVATGDH